LLLGILWEVEMNHGQFSGDPLTTWLTEAGPDRKMQLERDFWFEHGRDHWDAPKGAVVDGASIPQPLWSLVGSPYTGDYRRASIVHDVACDKAGTDSAKRRAADKMFFHACIAGGCGVAQAMLLYVGVRIGAWWNEHRGFSDIQAVKLSEDDESKKMRDAYHDVGKQVLDAGETDDPDVVEARTDEAMATRLGVID
jgi:hypothetical protein